MLHSFLYVPGDRPDLMHKAVVGPAHAVILDLEDGVATARAETARTEVASFLADPDRGETPLAVRVHPAQLAEDVDLAVRGGVQLIYLPKAELTSVERCRELLRNAVSAGTAGATGTAAPSIVALIETAQGWLDAPAMARAEGVAALALGEADLFAELGMDPELPDADRHAIRLRLVIASAAAGLRGPTAPASTDFSDLESFRAASIELRRHGFSARSAVHPAQVPVINEVFQPSPDELARARSLVDEFDAAVADGRAITVGGDGRMIDEAVVRSARRLLE